MRFPQGFPIPYHHEDKAARWKPGKAFLEERLNIESIEFVGDRQCTDLAVAADDQLFAANGVLTHNSASTLPKDRDLGLDQQLWLYGWAMRQLGVPVYGAIYSVSRTYQTKTKVQTLDERFNRILVAFEDDVLETTAADALSTVRSAYSKFNQKERHPDPEMCKRRCGFYDACLVGRSQGDAAERAFLVNTGHRVDFTRH
jgi:hypothetical protein